MKRKIPKVSIPLVTNSAMMMDQKWLNIFYVIENFVQDD